MLFTLPAEPGSLKTVERFTAHPSGCNTLPVPADSTANLVVDLDRDNRADLLFTLAHGYHDTLVGGPVAVCDSFQYSAVIKALSSLDSVAIASNESENLALFEEGEDIDVQLTTWGRRGYLFNTDPSGPWRQDFTGEAYLGVKIRWENEWNIAWILIDREENTLRVKEFAINLSRNRPIKAGQRQ